MLRISKSTGSGSQNVVGYKVVVGRFFNKENLFSYAWRKDHLEEFEDELEGPPERIATAEERRGQLNLEPDPEGAVCAVF